MPRRTPYRRPRAAGNLWGVPRDRLSVPHRWALGAVVVVALAARVAYVLSLPADPASLRALPDQTEYLTLARHLLGGHGLFFFDERFAAVADAYRMPLYPAFVAACGANLTVTRLAQAVVDASTVWAAALLAAALLPPVVRWRGAVLAPVIVAVDPFLIYFCGLVLSETLFTAMLAWGMLLLIVGGRGGRLAVATDAGDPKPYRPWLGTLLWLLGGLTLAASTLVRPSAAPLAVLLGVEATFATRPPGGRPAFRPRWPLPVAATMLLLTLAVLFPWAYRNSRVVGDWVWTTTNGGVTAYDGFNPDADGSSNQSVLQSLPQLKGMNEVERSTYLSQRAAEFVRENPKRALELAAIKAGRTWSPVPLSAEYGSWKHRLVGLAYGLPLYVLTLVGLSSTHLTRAAKVFLLVPAAYFTVVHMASVGSLRYRVPVEPLLAVVAAAGLSGVGRPPVPWRRAGHEEMSE